MPIPKPTKYLLDISFDFLPDMYSKGNVWHFCHQHVRWEAVKTQWLPRLVFGGGGGSFLGWKIKLETADATKSAQISNFTPLWNMELLWMSEITFKWSFTAPFLGNKIGNASSWFEFPFSAHNGLCHTGGQTSHRFAVITWIKQNKIWVMTLSHSPISLILFLMHAVELNLKTSCHLSETVTICKVVEGFSATFLFPQNCFSC